MFKDSYLKYIRSKEFKEFVVHLEEAREAARKKKRSVFSLLARRPSEVGKRPNLTPPPNNTPFTSKPSPEPLVRKRGTEFNGDSAEASKVNSRLMRRSTSFSSLEGKNLMVEFEKEKEL